MVTSRPREGIVTDEFGVDFAASDMSNSAAVREAFITALRARNGAQWTAGDLYVYGMDNDEAAFAQALDETTCSLKTVQNYASVCRTFPKPWRIVPLSMSHYAAASALASKQPTAALDLLRRAYDAGQSREWVRQEAAALMGDTRQEADVLLVYQAASQTFTASGAPDWLPDGFTRTIHVVQ